jgi:hypothetical protein
MKFVIRILLAAFMALGLTTSASIANTRAQGWSARVILWTLFAHLVLIGLAFILTAKSKPTAQGYRSGLSPAGWMFGSFFSYLVGLSCFLFIK